MRASLCLAALALCSFALSVAPFAAADPSPAPSAASSPSGESTAPAVTSPPSSPGAFPLDQDIRLRIAFARNHLGDSMVSHVCGGFLVLVAPFDGKYFKDSVKLVDKALGVYANDRFAAHPQEAVTVYVFGDTSAYVELCQARFGKGPDSPYGAYDPTTREIFANVYDGLTTLTHEMAHPLMQADFPKAPAWLREGLGSLYEAPVFPKPGEIEA